MKHKILLTLEKLQIFLTLSWYISCDCKKQELRPCFAIGVPDNNFSNNNDVKAIKVIPQNQRKWVREEVVLLVAEYFRTRDMSPIEKAESIDLVSRVLRKRAVTNGETISAMFRNSNGIKMQFGCIRSMDPQEIEMGHKGLSGASFLQKEIVNEYFANSDKIKMEAAEVFRKYL